MLQQMLMFWLSIGICWDSWYHSSWWWYRPFGSFNLSFQIIKKQSLLRPWTYEECKAVCLGHQLSEKGLGPIQLHAFLGCDKTSRLFGIVKGTVLKKFKVNSALQQAADIFDETFWISLGKSDDGELVIHNGKMDDTLNSFWLKRWQKALA